MEVPNTESSEKLLKSFVSLTESNSEAVSRFGGRMVVLCKFVDAVLPQLSSAQCRAVIALFREGVDHALSLTDDIAIPAAYQDSILHQTNVLLAALEQIGGGRR